MENIILSGGKQIKIDKGLYSKIQDGEEIYFSGNSFDGAKKVPPGIYALGIWDVLYGFQLINIETSEAMPWCNASFGNCFKIVN